MGNIGIGHAIYATIADQRLAAGIAAMGAIAHERDERGEDIGVILGFCDEMRAVADAMAWQRKMDQTGHWIGTGRWVRNPPKGNQDWWNMRTKPVYRYVWPKDLT